MTDFRSIVAILDKLTDEETNDLYQKIRTAVLAQVSNPDNYLTIFQLILNTKTLEEIAVRTAVLFCAKKIEKFGQ